MNINEAIGKSIFFLGAGASFDAKCKMSKDMLLDLQTRIITGSDNTFNDVEKETLQFLLSCLEYQNKWRSLGNYNNYTFTPNIEELALVIRRVKNRENFLPYPITGNWADKLIRLENEFFSDSEDKNLLDSIEKKIKNVLIPKWLCHYELNYLSPLKTLFEDFPYEKFIFDIISINHDLVIEDYFEKNNMIPWRGFSNNIWCGLYSEVPAEYGRIHLYKIHGSLDWVRLLSGEVRLKKDLRSIEEENIDDRHDPYIIFGHGTKIFSVDPFFSLIHDFKELLKKRNYIFVIGYSFFDPYINNLLLEAINNGQKKLVIVNPSFGPSQMSERLKERSKIENFFEGKDSNNSSGRNEIISYIESIQKNPFYSEVPEFNIDKISGETSLFYMPIGVKEFLDSFFSNKAELFINLIKIFENEKNSEKPF